MDPGCRPTRCACQLGAADLSAAGPLAKAVNSSLKFLRPGPPSFTYFPTRQLISAPTHQSLWHVGTTTRDGRRTRASGSNCLTHHDAGFEQPDAHGDMKRSATANLTISTEAGDFVRVHMLPWHLPSCASTPEADYFPRIEKPPRLADNCFVGEIGGFGS